MTIIWIGGGLLLVLVIVGVVITITSEKELVEERLERYLDASESGLDYDDLAGEEDQKKSSPLTEWLNGQVSTTNFGSSTADKLARADIKLKPGEYLGVMAGASIGTAVLSWVLLGKLEFTPLGGVFARYTHNERVWWAFGVFGDYNTQESYALPYAGASWVINERWTLSAVMPWPAVHYAPTKDWLFSLGASPSGAAWVRQEDKGDIAVSLSAWNFGVSAERRLGRNLWLSARTGVAGLRGLRYSNRENDIEEPDISVDAGAFFSLSLNVRPGALLP